MVQVVQFKKVTEIKKQNRVKSQVLTYLISYDAKNPKVRGSLIVHYTRKTAPITHKASSSNFSESFQWIKELGKSRNKSLKVEI